jgi:hypothetical protein
VVDLNLGEGAIGVVSTKEHGAVADDAEPGTVESEELDSNWPISEPPQDFEETAQKGFPDVADSFDQVSFLSKEKVTLTRDRPALRWLLGMLSLVLSMGLFFQVAYRERNQLAAWEPAFTPWLERACDLIACKIDPVRRIESISVETSTFTRLRGDTYRLSFLLKSSSLTPIAFPAVELTLTDAMDQPFLKRVLLASDVGPASGVLAASSEWPASIDISVQSAATPERVAGYRLVAFYP